MGSKLVSKEVMENKKYAELIHSTKEALEIIKSLRK
jgi:2-dehydro-3-deoxyphosphogluconate aldolase/(4S)-4-hydroxy-2-oxoglutarate aldolase